MTQTPPSDADARRSIAPVICYPVDTLPAAPVAEYAAAFASAKIVSTATAAPRDAAAIHVPAGHMLRIASVGGAQVGDLNLFNANDLNERFYSCLLYTSPSPRDKRQSRMPSSA